MTYVLSRKPEVGIGQPPGDLILDRSHPLTQGLILSCYNAVSDMERPPRNYVSGAYGSRNSVGSSGPLIAANTWWALNPVVQVDSGNRQKIINAAKFNGSTSWAFMPFDLSPYMVITVAMWMVVLTRAVSVVLEYNTNFTGNGFLFDAHDTDGVSTGPLNAIKSGAIQELTLSAPAVGEAHHYAMVFNRNGQTLAGAPWYTDGCLSSPTEFGPPGTPGPFATNAGLNFGARNKGASLFANVSVACVQIWGRELSPAEVYDYYRNTWQIFRPAVCSVGETA